MRIGILGAGNMAQGLGAHWTKAGHEVRMSNRSGAGTWADAAAFGDVVLLAVPADGVPDVLTTVDLSGKVLIDCTNAPDHQLMPATPPMAAQVAALAPRAHVVKAFNLCHESVWKRGNPDKVVPICGDDEAALATVSGLISDIGCAPAQAGRLERAAVLEATATFVIGLAIVGLDPRTALDG